jgi:hypothetical protein
MRGVPVLFPKIGDDVQTLPKGYVVDLEPGQEKM